MNFTVLSATASILVIAGSTMNVLAASDPQHPEGPRHQIDTEVDSPGKLIRVRAGENYQTALKRAAPGDAIELEAGATFQGAFVVPYKRPLPIRR